MPSFVISPGFCSWVFDVYQSLYSRTQMLWLLSWNLIPFYSVCRGLSSLHHPIGFLWSKLLEKKCERSQPIHCREAERCYPCLLPSFGCSVTTVWFPPVTSQGTGPLRLTAMSLMFMWLIDGRSAEQQLPPCASAELLHFWNEVCSLHVKWQWAVFAALLAAHRLGILHIEEPPRLHTLKK